MASKEKYKNLFEKLSERFLNSLTVRLMHMF